MGLVRWRDGYNNCNHRDSGVRGFLSSVHSICGFRLPLRFGASAEWVWGA